MYSVKSTFSFEAAHRLYGVDTYSKECSDSVHGHSYKVTVEISRSVPNPSGMVMDFKLLKKIGKETIEDKYDHSIILRDIDPLVPIFKAVAPEQKLNVVEAIPTAEWMASEFYFAIRYALEDLDMLSEVDVDYVSVQETENNIATYRR